MGFESRDYAWDSPSRRAYLGGHSAVKILIGLNAAFYLLQLLTAGIGTFLPNEGPLTAWFSLIPDRVVYRGEIWRLLTYSFLHAERDFWHILINMYLLYIFGERAEARLGSKEFTLFYLAAAVCGGVFFTGLELFFPSVAELQPGVPLICVGASGAVMGVVALVAVWEPQMQILLFFLIPVPLWALATFYALWETYYVLAQISMGVQSSVAHGAHFGGLIFGLAYVKLGWNLDLLVDRLPRFSFSGLKRSVGAGPKVRLHRPDSAEKEDDELEQAADAALAKIHASGEASLTRKERHTLKLYSERAKAKRR